MMPSSTLLTETIAPPAVLDITPGEFQLLLEKEFKPRSEQARVSVERGVKVLAEQALEHTSLIDPDIVSTIQAIIAAIDEKLTAQINKIMHHPDFQAMESAWRGLNYLVYNTEVDETLKIRFMPIAKREISRNVRKYKGIAWDQSPLFKKIYEDEYGQLGGEPFGCLIGDYYFDHSPPDVELLNALGRIAAAAHVPFVAAASPHLMHMDSWQELANPRDLTKIFQTPEYAAWRSLRASEDSRYLVLTMPRTLGRLPYGTRTDPVDDFDFEEEVDGRDADKYLWCNAAYALGVNITRSFKLYGWLSRIRGVESGGLVEDLPAHTFPSDDGGVDLKCPTEIAISDRREAELSKNGFLPLIHRKNTDMAAFIGAQTLNKPTVYEDPDATANAELSARLTYMFAISRFAHFLKCIVRDKIGSFKERSEVEEWLNRWIRQYVLTTAGTPTETDKARQPLMAAEVQVDEVRDNPGYYNARFYLRPHYQLEGLTISLRLVSRLPSARAS